MAKAKGCGVCEKQKTTAFCSAPDCQELRRFDVTTYRKLDAPLFGNSHIGSVVSVCHREVCKTWAKGTQGRPYEIGKWYPIHHKGHEQKAEATHA